MASRTRRGLAGSFGPSVGKADCLCEFRSEQTTEIEVAAEARNCYQMDEGAMVSVELDVC